MKSYVEGGRKKASKASAGAIEMFKSNDGRRSAVLPMHLLSHEARSYVRCF